MKLYLEDMVLLWLRKFELNRQDFLAYIITISWLKHAFNDDLSYKSSFQW